FLIESGVFNENQHEGNNNGKLVGSGKANQVWQDIPVEPNESYTLTGWFQSEGSLNNNEGRFGVMSPDGRVLKEVKLGLESVYTHKTISFHSGTNEIVRIYVGIPAKPSDTAIRFDDFALHKGSVIEDESPDTPDKEVSPEHFLYTNEVLNTGADPGVFRAPNGIYYAYPTGSGNFSAYSSTDLVHWRD